MAERLKKGENPDQASFELGFCLVLQTFEKLAQDLHRFGFMNKNLPLTGHLLPFANLSSLHNEKPESISYERARQIVSDWVNGLTAAEATLARLRGDSVKMPIQVGRIRLDMNGDGEATEDESFWKLFVSMSGRPIVFGEVERFVIGFDRADVEWLRGYCHLMAGIGDVVLAYDWHEFFDATASLLFAKAQTLGVALADAPKAELFGMNSEFADAIAAIHLMRFKVSDKERLASALNHFEAVIAQSRLMWKLILREADNDNEWIPSPKQTSALAGMNISEVQISAWHDFLNETESVLKGKKLIPHWRYQNRHGNHVESTVGVNLRKAFLEPTDFDIVLIAHGAGVAPFIEKG
ncbi:MAG: hypothetical protein IPK83_16845 [Planctomycetes bacterium]|nr:hypothetical protein [Planctomycetota bacterium]